MENLRINVDDYIVPVGEEITTPTEPRPPAGKGPRRLRPAEPFYPVPKRWLTSRAMDEVFDIRARLAIFLWNESRFGSRPVRFTWDKAAELGIARNRTRELRRLAARNAVNSWRIGFGSKLRTRCDQNLLRCTRGV